MPVANAEADKIRVTTKGVWPNAEVDIDVELNRLGSIHQCDQCPAYASSDGARYPKPPVVYRLITSIS